MGNPYFQFKNFTVYHDQSAMKVTTDSCLFGAWCAAEISKISSAAKVLDIGAGTGLLSLMIAQKNEIEIDAVEINSAAAKQANDNVTSSPFQNNINVFNEDINLFEKDSYDCIISNPPFYENELESSTSEKNKAHHSHSLKWEQLFSIIKRKLKEKGHFFLLLPYKRKQEAESLLQMENLFIEKVVVVKQSIAHQPFRLMIKGSKTRSHQQWNEMSIKDEKNEYTSEFIELLKDYYLYL